MYTYVHAGVVYIVVPTMAGENVGKAAGGVRVCLRAWWDSHIYQRAQKA